MKKLEFLTFDVDIINSDYYNSAYEEYKESSKNMSVSVWYPKYMPKTSYELKPKELKGLDCISSVDTRYYHFLVGDTYCISQDIVSFDNSYTGEKRKILIKDNKWSVSIEAGVHLYSINGYKSYVQGEYLNSSYSFEPIYPTFLQHLFLSDSEILYSTKDKHFFDAEVQRLKDLAVDELKRYELRNRYCNLITTLCNGNFSKIGKLKVNLINYGNSCYETSISYRNVEVFKGSWDGGNGYINYYFTRSGKWEDDLLIDFEKEVLLRKEKIEAAKEKERLKIESILNTY